MTTDPTPVLDPLLSRRTVCATLGISQEQLRRLLRDGRLRAIKLGNRSTRIRKSDLDAFLEEIEQRHVRPEGGTQ